MAKRNKPGQVKKGTSQKAGARGSGKPSGKGRTTAKSGSGQRTAGKSSRPPVRKPAPRTEAAPPQRSFEDDMDAREALLEGSLDQVVGVYEEALEESVYFPVVFLVDCEDAVGGKLAREWAGREEVDEAIEANRVSSDHALTTTFAQCLSFRDCQDYVPKMFPYLQGTFQQAPPEGTFIAVVVARGGAATFFVPLNAEA